MRKFRRDAAFPRAGGSGRGLHPVSPPDLPRGCDPGGMIRRVVRCTLFLAGLALMASACGSGSRTATTPPAAARDVAVIRGWADALRHGRLERAARYFAIPSTVSNGTSPIELTSRDDVRFFNRTLPCGAKVLHAEDTGAYVVATFRLTERPGPGSCGSGVGGEASTAFLIRRHRIKEWRRVVEPAPDATPSGPQT